MVEYNQCQSSLKALYELGIPGNVEEFTAYRIMMLLHGRNRSGLWPSPGPTVHLTLLTKFVIVELNLYVSQLTSKQKASPAVKHALDVQRSLALGNYHAFFDQYLNAPNMGAYIMDHFVDRERLRALLIMTKACVLWPSSMPTSDVNFIGIYIGTSVFL